MRRLGYMAVLLSMMSYFLMSCDNADNTVPTTGYLELGVSKNVEVVTKAMSTADQSLAVDICTGAKDSIVKHFSDYNDMAGERVLLNIGTYKVKVTSNPLKKLEFEKPTFYGETANVAVTAGKTTNVSVECFLTCVKVTTEFTKPVKNQFASCIAKISDKSGSYLEYGMEESRAGYFQPDYLVVDLTVTNKEGLTFKLSKLIEKTEAKDHYHLIFDMKESGSDDSGMDFDISIETDPTNDEKHTVTVPLPETGYQQEPPVVKLDGVTDGASLTIKESEKSQDQYNITVSAQSSNIGIGKVQLLVNSDSEIFKDFPSIVTLSDLREDSKEYILLKNLGFELPLDYSDISSEFKYKFTATDLDVGNYTFKMLISDRNGQEVTCSFAYKIMSEIQTEAIDNNLLYVWSRFAYLRGYAVNPSNGGSFKYKKTADTEWMEVTDGVTFDKDGYASVKVTGLSSGTSYDYKFIQMGAEGEIRTFTTDTEVEVPNLNLDTWSNNYTLDGWWSSGNEGTSTLDLYPTLKDDGVKDFCVKMYTSYVNKTIVIFPVKKLVTGNLFLGEYKGIAGTEGVKLDFGRKYESRPSKLNFQYKYTSTKINVVNNNKGAVTSEDDKGFIYFLLTDKIYKIDTRDENTFIKEENYVTDDHILAYGTYTIGQTVNSFTKGTIELIYKKLNKKPSYIIIVATSSKKGDYFTGGEGSTLWLDELDLEYPSDYPVITK